MENKASKLNKFYCPEHQKGFETEAGGEIYCQVGKHYLASEFPPVKDYLEYCCGCQRFIPFSITGRYKEIECPSCEKAIESRYFCHQCRTLTNDVIKNINDKKFNISAEGKLLPDCPACQAKTKANSLHLHECEILKIDFIPQEYFVFSAEKMSFKCMKAKLESCRINCPFMRILLMIMKSKIKFLGYLLESKLSRTTYLKCIHT